MAAGAQALGGGQGRRLEGRFQAHRRQVGPGEHGDELDDGAADGGQWLAQCVGQRQRHRHRPLHRLAARLPGQRGQPRRAAGPEPGDHEGVDRPRRRTHRDGVVRIGDGSLHLTGLRPGRPGIGVQPHHGGRAGVAQGAADGPGEGRRRRVQGDAPPRRIERECLHGAPDLLRFVVSRCLRDQHALATAVEHSTDVHRLPGRGPAGEVGQRLRALAEGDGAQAQRQPGGEVRLVAVVQPGDREQRPGAGNGPPCQGLREAVAADLPRRILDTPAVAAHGQLQAPARGPGGEASAQRPALARRQYAHGPPSPRTAAAVHRPRS